MSEAAPTLLETLIEKRSALATEASTILDTASTEARDLTVEEEARAAALSDEMSSLSKEIELRESIERSRFAAAEAARSVSVKSEPLTYNREKRFSYFKDLATVQAGLVGDVSAAQERLNRHAAEMDVEFSKRDKRRAEKAETEMRGITGSEVSPFESRAGNRTDGTGGYFVPPIFLIDDYIQYLRYGRPFTNSLRQVPLPTGTDTINIPKLSTGTLTGIQTADNAALSNQDIADTQVTASVKTVGGYVDVSLQLLEQSPHQIIDEVILQDLIADYNLQVDSQSLNGTGSSGQILGVLNVSGINTTTYTSGSPTQVGMWTPLAQAISQLVQTRKLSTDGVKCWMHPRRWYWMASGLDSSNRPLIVPSTMGQFNPMAENVGAPAAEGYVGNLVLGNPVYLDGSIPTNLGAGTNQDDVVFIRGDDTLFFEGELRTDVFREILSSTAGVRFRAYNYIAQLTRYAQSVSVVSGTGLVAPSGF